MLLAVVLTSCRTADLPPGFSRVGGVLQSQTSYAASPEAIYSLMTWYEEANAETNPPKVWIETVAETKDKARKSLHTQWKLALLKAADPILKEDIEKVVDINPKACQNRTDWEALDSAFRKAKAILHTEHLIAVPIEQCENDAFWNKKTKYGKTDFVVWAQNRKLAIPDQKGLDKTELIKKIGMLQEEINLKKSIQGNIQKARKLNQEKNPIDALQLLHKTYTELPENPLQLIEDQDTIKQLQDDYKKQPRECINQVIGDIETKFQEILDKIQANNLKTQLSSIEKTASENLIRWQNDLRFEKALEEEQQRIRDIIKKLQEFRAQLQAKDINTYAQKEEFWLLITQTTAMINEIEAKKDTDFAIYFLTTINDLQETTFAQALAQNIKKQITDIIPQAAGKILDTAKKASDISQKHAYAYALCKLVRAIGDLAGDTTQNGNAHQLLIEAKKLEDNLRKLIEEKYLAQTISIKDMEAATPGLGLTYTRDVANALNVLIKSFNLDKFITIAEPGTPLSPWGYVLYNGVVAEYDGNATTERHAFRSIQRYGDIKRVVNPAYEKDNKQPKDRFDQEVIEQLIHVKEIERQAHIRVFMNIRGPGFTTLVDVNEFYPKKFVVEESHPFNDVKIVSYIEEYNIDKLKPRDPLPTLKQDRIWTPGEMLDWARKDSLAVFSLKLLYHINQFPLYLATRANTLAQNGDLNAATEQWALCNVLCENLNFEGDPATLLKADTPPVATSYETTINALRKQRTELAELKRNVLNTLLAKTDELLKSKQDAETKE